MNTKTMKKETLIIQKTPRVEVIFYDDEFEILKSGLTFIDNTKYSKLESAHFTKGGIPWVTGLLTSIIDLITGHGIGHWKRGKGKLELSTAEHKHSIELVNYDREQTRKAAAIFYKSLDKG